MTRDRLNECARCPLPWGSKKIKKLEELKGKPLLTVLFQHPKHLAWVRTEAKKSSRFEWLSLEIDMLLDAVATIRPIAVCSEGNPVRYWSVLGAQITGFDLRCADKECRCYATGAYGKPSYVPHTFKTMMPYLPTRMEEKVYLEGFRKHYGLSARYDFDKYLDWLLNNATFE